MVPFGRQHASVIHRLNVYSRNHESRFVVWNICGKPHIYGRVEIDQENHCMGLGDYVVGVC